MAAKKPTERQIAKQIDILNYNFEADFASIVDDHFEGGCEDCESSKDAYFHELRIYAIDDLTEND